MRGNRSFIFDGSLSATGGLFGGGAFADDAKRTTHSRAGISEAGLDFLTQLEQAEQRDSRALGQSNAERTATKAARPQTTFGASSKQGSIVFGDDSSAKGRAWSSSSADQQLEIRLMAQQRAQQQQQQQHEQQQQRRMRLQQQQHDPERRQQQEERLQQQMLREQQRQWKGQQQRSQMWKDGRWDAASDARPMSALWDGDRQKAEAVSHMNAAGCKGADKMTGRNGGWRDVMRMNEFELRGNAHTTSAADLISSELLPVEPYKGGAPQKRLPPSYYASQQGGKANMSHGAVRDPSTGKLLY